MVIGANRMLFQKSVPQTQIADVSTLGTPDNTVSAKAVLPDGRRASPQTAVPSTSPKFTSPDRIAELIDLVKASDPQRIAPDHSSSPLGHLGTESGTPVFPGKFGSDADAEEFKKPSAFEGWNWLNPVRVPGGEASDIDWWGRPPQRVPGFDDPSWSDMAGACAVGGLAGSVIGGIGAGPGCILGMAENQVQEAFSDAFRSIKELLDKVPDAATISPPPEKGSGAQPTDPKRDPGSEGDVQSRHPSNVKVPALSWLSPIKPRVPVGDPIGSEIPGGSNVLIQRGQATDPNPADDPNEGGAMKSILSTSGAVTDPTPDVIATQRQRLNNLLMANLRA